MSDVPADCPACDAYGVCPTHALAALRAQVEQLTADNAWLRGELAREERAAVENAAQVEQLTAELSDLRWRVSGGMVNDVSSEPTWRESMAVKVPTPEPPDELVAQLRARVGTLTAALRELHDATDEVIMTRRLINARVAARAALAEQEGTGHE